MSTRRPSPTARSDRRRDDGAVFVELILAMPLMLVMVFGIVWAGFGWRAGTQVNSATRAAARVASRDGAQPSADYDALKAISAALPSDLVDNIKRVVIFTTSSANGTVPSSCLTVGRPNNTNPVGQSNVCNVYSSTQVKSATTANFGSSSSCSGKWDQNWCPKGRNADASTTFPGTLDYIGVYIETVKEDVTVSFYPDNTIKRQVVFRIEPELDY